MKHKAIGRVMFAQCTRGDFDSEFQVIADGVCHAYRGDAHLPVLVLPLDDLDGLVEQTAHVLCKADGFDWAHQGDPMTSGSGDDDQVGYRELARCILSSLGVRFPRKGRK